MCSSIIDVMSDQVKGKAKPQLEQLIEANGGKFYQMYDAVPDMVCIGDKSKPTRLFSGYILIHFGRNGASGVSHQARRRRYCATFMAFGLY